MNAEIISTDPSAPTGADPAEGEWAPEWRELDIPLELHGERLDKALATLIPEFSRSYLQQTLARGDVSMSGGVLTKPAVRVKAGQALSVVLRPTPQAQAFKPESVPLSVVFEDEQVLVIDKPAGLVVHPAAGNWSGTLLNGLLMHHAGAAMLPRAGIVHRLDKDTSGLMVVGKTRTAVDALVRQIASRAVQRYYLAVAQRPWTRGSGITTVDKPVGRDPANRLRMAVLGTDNATAKSALTWVVPLVRGGGSTLCGCKLFTGRTHQIRVHMAWLGHPLVGDTTYGGQPTVSLKRQALHATRLDFAHPVSGRWLSFTAPLPADMAAGLAAEGLHYNANDFGPTVFGL